MRDLLKKVLLIASIIGSLDSLIGVTNIEYLEGVKTSNGWNYLLILLAIALALYCMYTLITNSVTVISKNQTLHLRIKYGDIFKCSNKIKVIPIDDDLTSEVKKKAHSKSVHYQFMTTKWTFYANEINNLSGKSDRILAIGDDDYYLLKVGKFDANNRIFLDSYLEYFKMVYDLCEFIDNNAKGTEVVLSNIGTNVRIGNDNLDKMERLTLLKTIIESYNFKSKVYITILLRRELDNLDKYQLSKI